MRAPRIYTNTNPAGVRGSTFRWFLDPWTPAGLKLVYILSSRGPAQGYEVEVQVEVELFDFDFGCGWGSCDFCEDPTSATAKTWCRRAYRL